MRATDQSDCCGPLGGYISLGSGLSVQRDSLVAKACAGFIGCAFAGATWVAIGLIIHQPQGQWLLLLAVGDCVLADIGGYVAGNLFGKHKLAPVVSPGKTWEGFFGGLFFQLLLIAGYALCARPVQSLGLSLLIIPVSLYSVLGDLFESMLKRQQGVKDSSQILPGHGGVLDRIDGIDGGVAAVQLAATRSRALV